MDVRCLRRGGKEHQDSGEHKQPCFDRTSHHFRIGTRVRQAV
jgi:hypothetical protein